MQKITQAAQPVVAVSKARRAEADACTQDQQFCLKTTRMCDGWETHDETCRMGRGWIQEQYKGCIKIAFCRNGARLL
jgi:hypothetical protein